MDASDCELRIMMLGCMRENATNMRLEHQNLRDRIQNALERARASLVTIESLTEKLKEMKQTVQTALDRLDEHVAENDVAAVEHNVSEQSSAEPLQIEGELAEPAENEAEQMAQL
ncbi:uncharacterized protein LOC115632988 [Scaptodrosophila lebanonensis]|uniref:Uncharacterized protein LOC115632988 n=1 Tax=Drosophila lebanonensis TaxID=7225 RepID=A0A6J2UDE1_DROLE|nr:uncharacterized protein LOC115632988 [Scaptodrosophila lebanonensis]